MKAFRRSLLALSPRISILQRFTLTLASIVLLMMAASGAGLWFATSIQKNTRTVSRDADLSSKLLDLQISWQSVVETINTFSIVTPPAETRQQLETLLDEYNQQLVAFSAQPLGITPEIISENQQITQEMAQTLVETGALADQMYRLIEQGDWISALNTRQSAMTELQARMNKALNLLNANIQNDVSVQTAEIRRVQNRTRNFGVAAILMALGISLWFGWASRRSTFEPLNQLTANIQRLTQVKSVAELNPVTPLPQRDEIGDLSRAFAQMVEWVRRSYESLEERIAERTEGLERRTLQLQVAAEIARDIASTPSLEELLILAVNLIRDRFGFYHSGVFLSDEPQEYAVLRAATGEAGREMLARGHKLKIGETGLVGYVARSGEPRIALDVGMDAVHFKNPLLPETRSEVALPIKLGNRVIGVLDVQNQEPAAFDEESITILQIISDQIAIAIQNARLLQQAQENLNQLERAYRRYDILAWERFLQSTQTVGYHFDGMNVRPLEDSDSADRFSKPELGIAVGVGGEPISIPLRVRGDTIGILDVWPQGEQFSVAETYLLATVSSRLSQILESARLFEEAKARAAREEAINRLTANLARSLDTDSVLQIAVRELARLPSVVESTVFLGTTSDIAPPELGIPEIGKNGVKGDGGGRHTDDEHLL